MKKLTLILAMSSLVALTACQKEVTEVKKGSTVEVKTQNLSTNNAADIKADMDKIQALALQQENQATDLNQRLSKALESKNEGEVKKLFPEFKTAMLNNLTALEKLQLKSQEVTELRTKLNAMTHVGLNLQEKVMDENVKPEDLQALEQQGGQLQQEIMLLSQKIQMITTGQAQNDPTAAMSEEAVKKALAEQLANSPTDPAPQPAQ